MMTSRGRKREFCIGCKENMGWLEDCPKFETALVYRACIIPNHAEPPFKKRFYTEDFVLDCWHSDRAQVFNQKDIPV
jgi:hypothetical protein